MGNQCNCPLKGHVEVPFYGSGKSGIMLVGESPGRDEVKLQRQTGKGRPFVGDAGKMLVKAALEANFDLSEVRICNSAKCMIDKKEHSPKEQRDILSACRAKLIKNIEHFKPKLIILLGDFALRQVTKAGGITKKRGQLIHSKEFNTLCLPTFHPAYILRNRDMLPYLVEDLTFARKLYEKDFKEENLDHKTIKTRIIFNFQTILNHLDIAEKPIAIGLDTETQGLDYINPSTYVISFSFADKEESAFQVFLYDYEKVSQKVERSYEYINKLKQLRALVDHPMARVYMQNGNYDKHHLLAEFRRAKLRPPQFKSYVLDLQAGAHLLNENRFKQASLEQLRSSFLHEQSNWKKKFYAAADPTNMIAADRKALAFYAGEDANSTLRIGKVIVEEIKKDKKLIRYLKRLSMPVISQALFMLEENGVYFDGKAKEEVRTNVTKKVKEKYNAAFKLIPQKVIEAHKEKGLAFTRRDFISDVLFSSDGFSLEPPTITPSGRGSTAAGDRIQMIEDRKVPAKAREFLTIYDEWSEWSGILSKGINGLEKHIRSDGRIHANFTTVIPVTGRCSASSPNLMAMPKRSKAAKETGRLIAAEDDTRVLVECDLSQAELRYMAHESGDKELIRVYRNGEDVHTNTAKALSSKPWDKMSEQERKDARQAAKPSNFGLLYLMSAPGFVSYCLRGYGLKKSLRWAENYIEDWFNLYYGVRQYHNDMIELVKQDKQVRSLFGRIRRLPDIDSNQYGIRNEAMRQAVNFPIQGPASDHALFSLAYMIQQKLIDNKDCKPVLFIHDSICFSVKKDKLYYYANIIKDTMENVPLDKYFGIHLRVPIIADIVVGPNRAEVVTLEEYKG